MSPFEKLLLGFFSPFHGLRLIFGSKKKLVLSLIPFVLGLLFIFAGFGWAYAYLGGVVQGWLSQYEAALGFLFALISGIAMVFTWLAAFTLFFLAAYAVVSLVGGPFYSLLAEDTFRTESDQKKRGSSVRLMMTMFLLSLVKISIFLVVGILFFIMSFIPVLNLVSSYFVLMVVAFDCSDYAFEVDFLTLRQRFGFFFKHF